jgi:PhnB protein
MYVEDVDETVQQAIDAGATVATPVEDMFWGDRFGAITDPFGHLWQIATHVEDIEPEEMEKRAKEAMAAMSQ